MKWKPVHEFFHCAFAVLDCPAWLFRHRYQNGEAQQGINSPYLVFRSVGRNVGIFRHTSSCLGSILEDPFFRWLLLRLWLAVMETLFRVTPLQLELRFLKVHNVPYAGLFRLSSSALEMLVPGHAVGKVMGRGRANVDNIRKYDQDYFPGKRKRGKDYKEGMFPLDNRFMREQLLSEVLEALIVIRGLIVQKTKLISDCCRLLKDLLDSVLLENAKNKKHFIQACIGGLQIHEEKRGRSNLNSYVYAAKKLMLPSWLILFEYKNVNTIWFEEVSAV
nr:auxin transport protein BIG [Tanacetum cinerariifolium]